MQNILICSDGSSYADSLYHYGALLAQRYSAAITVLYVTDIRSQQVVSTGNLSGSLGLGASEALMQELVSLEHEKAKLNNARARLVLKHATDQLHANGIDSFQIVHKKGYLLDCLREIPTDLIVLGKRGENAAFASEHLGANLDRIIRSTSSPCLVVPQTVRPWQTMLLAYDGSPTGQRLLSFVQAMPARPRLHVVTATQEQAAGEKRLQEARAVLGEAATHYHQAVGDPETVLAEFITKYDIDLLAIGAYGQSRIRHLVVGSTTMQLLRSSSIPVLLVR